MVDAEQRSLDQTLDSFYKDNLNFGVEDLQEQQSNQPEQIPQIKLTHAMSKNFLANGMLSQPGRFYHTGKKAEYSIIDCHILYIKKTYIKQSARIKASTGADKRMTYIIGAMMEDTGEPFLTFIKGANLPIYWKFQKELLDTMQEIKTPMFALTIRLSQTDTSTDHGVLAVIKPTILKLENGLVQKVTDLSKLEAIKQQAIDIKEVIEKMGEKEPVSAVDIEDHYSKMADEQNL